MNKIKTTLIFGIVFVFSFAFGLSIAYYTEKFDNRLKEVINVHTHEPVIKTEFEFKSLFHYLRKQHDEIIDLKNRVQKLEVKCSDAEKS